MEQNSGFITLEDVKSAIGDGDPAKTNASAIRASLGRGSFATIQKHLDALRLQNAPTPPAASGQAPEAPTEAITAIWNAAYTSAQVFTLSRLERLSCERDGLLSQAQAQASDIAALTAQVDALEASLAAQSEATVVELQAAQNQVLQARTDAQRFLLELQEARETLERTKAEAASAAALAERDATIERQTLQSELDRVKEQFAALRALQIFMTQKTPPAPEPQQWTGNV